MRFSKTSLSIPCTTGTFSQGCWAELDPLIKWDGGWIQKYMSVLMQMGSHSLWTSAKRLSLFSVWKYLDISNSSEKRWGKSLFWTEMPVIVRAGASWENSARAPGPTRSLLQLCPSLRRRAVVFAHLTQIIIFCGGLWNNRRTSFYDVFAEGEIVCMELVYKRWGFFFFAGKTS